MIRPATANDINALMTLANVLELFSPEELEQLHQMMTASVGQDDNDQPFWLTDDEDGLVSLAYCEPERMTSGTWNLQLIAVHPTHQKQGRGTQMLLFIEQILVERGARLLLVETMGTPDFQHVRAFYQKNNYDEEARIRGFYQPGADKVVFCKVLSNQGS
jgi:GNAT superfamily N-acetyltransferase